jgi:L-lactate dehydrogenase (cytochrome)/(S)-mandelate dehydrogenase
MLDGGVRRGADILTAICLGARFVFVGRATLYGAVAAGLPGVRKAIGILRREIDLVMGQIGCPSLQELGPRFLLQAGTPWALTDAPSELDGAAGLGQRRFADKSAQR